MLANATAKARLPRARRSSSRRVAAGLGWWRVRHSNLRTTRAAFRLRQAYRLHSLQAALHERRIEGSVALLRSAGVEPLLGKGWAAARLYPAPGLRPYGDIDLYVAAAQHVRPEDRQAARFRLTTSPVGGVVCLRNGDQRWEDASRRGLAAQAHG